MEIGKTQNYLVNALRNLPSDNALSEVRHHLLQAMRKMEHVSKKRMRKGNQQPQTNQWQYIPNYGMASPQQAARVIENLDQMISQEKAKLENIVQDRQDKDKKPIDKKSTDYDMIVDWTNNHK